MESNRSNGRNQLPNEENLAATAEKPISTDGVPMTDDITIHIHTWEDEKYAPEPFTYTDWELTTELRWYGIVGGKVLQQRWRCYALRCNLVWPEHTKYEWRDVPHFKPPAVKSVPH